MFAAAKAQIIKLLKMKKLLLLPVVLIALLVQSCGGAAEGDQKAGIDGHPPVGAKEEYDPRRDGDGQHGRHFCALRVPAGAGEVQPGPRRRGAGGGRPPLG